MVGKERERDAVPSTAVGGGRSNAESKRPLPHKLLQTCSAAGTSCCSCPASGSPPAVLLCAT